MYIAFYHCPVLSPFNSLNSFNTSTFASLNVDALRFGSWELLL